MAEVQYEEKRRLPEEVTDCPALGRMARLGDLYDARSDLFLNISILKKQPPPLSCTSTSMISSYHHSFLNTESYAGKRDGFNLTAGLPLNMLSGCLGSVAGSGQYLTEEHLSTKKARSVVMLSRGTKVDQLFIYADELQDCISERALQSAAEEELGASATHLVVRIDWGAKVVVAVEETCTGGGSVSDMKGKLNGELGKIFSHVNLEANARVGVDKGETISDRVKSCSVQVFADVEPREGTAWDQVQDLVNNFGVLLKDVNEGRGKPITYGLAPITLLQAHFNVQRSAFFWKQIDNEIVSSFITAFDKVQCLKFKMRDFLEEISDHKHCLTEADEENAQKINDDFLEADLDFKIELKQTFQAVQKGIEPEPKLSELRSKYSIQNCRAFKCVESYLSRKGDAVGQKISQAKMLSKIGVRYLNKDEAITTAVHNLKRGSGCGFCRTYILLIGKNAENSMPTLYRENYNFFLELAHGTSNSAVKDSGVEFVLVDGRLHEAAGSDPDLVTVMYYLGGAVQSEDYCRDVKEIEIVGTYTLVSNGNYDAYLSACGIWNPQRSLITGAGFTVTISEDGGRYEMRIDVSSWLFSRTNTTTFRLNEEFGEMTVDGLNAKSIVTREGCCLVQVQNLTHSSEKRRVTVRTFTRTEMRVDLTANGVTATRLFKRV